LLALRIGRQRFRRGLGSARAGKSSLMVALLRLVELRVGRITIDGVDIASVPLHVPPIGLRASVS
jgi:ABC-type branched-subunit amino acid transport system ATPase component